MQTGRNNQHPSCYDSVLLDACLPNSIGPHPAPKNVAGMERLVLLRGLATASQKMNHFTSATTVVSLVTIHIQFIRTTRWKFPRGKSLCFMCLFKIVVTRESRLSHSHEALIIFSAGARHCHHDFRNSSSRNVDRNQG